MTNHTSYDACIFWNRVNSAKIRIHIPTGSWYELFHGAVFSCVAVHSGGVVLLYYQYPASSALMHADIIQMVSLVSRETAAEPAKTQANHHV